VRRRAQPANPAPPGECYSSSRVYTIATCTGSPFKTLLAHPWRPGSLRGHTPLVDREARWVQRGQLVCSLDPATGSVHCCEVPCTLSEKHQHQGGDQRRASSVCVSLREPASRIGGCECMGRLTVHCCASHLCSQEGESSVRVLPPHNLGQLSHTRTLRADPSSEQQVHSKVSLRRAVDAV
jgi:hypothetical protein